MLSCHFTVVTGEDASPKSIQGMEFCVASPPLEEEGFTLQSSMWWTTLVEECTNTVGDELRRPSCSTYGLRWSALCSSLQGRVTADSLVEIPNAISRTFRSRCCNAALPEVVSDTTFSPFHSFLFVYHSAHPGQFSDEWEGLSLWTVALALRWTLRAVAHHLAAVMEDKTATAGTSRKITRDDILLALHEMVSSTADSSYPLQCAAAVLFADCFWQRPRNNGGCGTCWLGRVRWSDALVRSLTLVLSLIREGHPDQSPPPLWCAVELSSMLVLPQGLAKLAPSNCGSAAVSFGLVVLRLECITHSRYHKDSAITLVEHLLEQFLRPAERARDDGTDAFREAHTGGTSTAECLKRLRHAQAHYDRCRRLALQGLRVPVLEATSLTSREGKWGRTTDVADTEREHRVTLQRSRATAPRRLLVDGAVEALWRWRLLPVNTTAGVDAEDLRHHRLGTMERLSAWFEKLKEPFRPVEDVTAVSPELWAGLLHVSLEEGPLIRKAIDHGGAVHDAVTHHAAVEPATAALQWRTECSPDSIWCALLPRPTALEYAVYSLLRLLVVGTSNFALCALEQAKLGKALSPSAMKETATECEKCLGLVWRLLAAQRPFPETLQALLSPSLIPPFQFRLLLHSHPLPRGCEPGSEDCPAAHRELLWCLQMSVKVQVRSGQLWQLAGEAERRLRCVSGLREAKKRWEQARASYARGEGLKPEGELEGADGRVIWLNDLEWETLKADIQRYL